MANLALPKVSAQINGDASGLARSLDKAAADVKTKTAGMDREIGRFTTGIERKFGASGIAMGFLRGVGFGTSFQIVEHLSEKISDHWKNAANAAKELEQAVERMSEMNEAQGMARLNLDQQALLLEEKIAKLQKEKKGLDSVYHPILTNNGEYDPVLNPIRNHLDPQAINSRTPEEQERYAKLGIEITKLAGTLADANRKINDDFKKASDELGDKLAAAAKEQADKKKREAEKEEKWEEKQSKPGNPLTDSFTKIGLLSGAGLNGAGVTRIAEKQLTVLQQIKDAIVRGRSEFANGLATPGTTDNLI